LITGYNDAFGRTVASGLGTATSGQVYTLSSTASQYSVAPGTASILPNGLGDRYGWVDRQTSDIDITGQVALSGIPASNLMTVGFTVKFSPAGGTNYYNVVMMVATGGAISLRFSRVVAGGLSTISTVATGLTYVANTFYNLRVVAYWSDALQAHVLRSKLWLVGTDQPGGWMAAATDAGVTQYTAGTGAGIFTRDEAATPGLITAKIQNVVAKTYGLPIPATTDTACADPAFTYPKQTALQSLADAADTALLTLDPLVSLAGLFPRVRVSASNWTINSASAGNFTPAYTATEFNIGTDTNLGYDSQGLELPAGVWLLTFEIELAEAALSDAMLVSINGGFTAASPIGFIRTNTAQSGDDSTGGTGHFSALTVSTDPAATVRVTVTLTPNSSSAIYTVKYSALSAIKISDYFA
jgi:hypothetical protein